jgi:hypothetical protein
VVEDLWDAVHGVVRERRVVGLFRGALAYLAASKKDGESPVSEGNGKSTELEYEELAPNTPEGVGVIR